jgi:DNA-binding transcriptional ArsR family regulator
MQRDMELGRKILLELESKEDFSTYIRPEIVGATDLQVSYHIKLLAEAGLVNAKNWSTDDGSEWATSSLTTHGHDFLDAARNEGIWKKAKELILSKGGVLTFEMLKLALAETLKTQLFGSGS